MTAVAWRSVLAGLVFLVAIPSFGQTPSSGMDRGLMPGEVAGVPNEVWDRWADSRAFAARHLITIYDTNRDGKVSLDEFLAFHRKYLPQWDRDADGAISLNEYLLGCVALQQSQMQGTDQNTEQTAWIRRNREAALSQSQKACMNSAQQFKTAAGRGIGNVPLLQAEEAVRKMFAQMDRNQDGVLSADELFMAAPDALALFADNTNAPDATRIASEQLQGIFANTRNRRIAIYDLNGDGKVSLDEFMSHHRKKFGTWDSAGDGFVSRDEYLQGCVKDRTGLFLSTYSNARNQDVLEGMQRVQKKDCESLSWQFMALDEHRTGKVSLAQFEITIRQLFERLDRNRDGFVTGDELLMMPSAEMWPHVPTDEGWLTTPSQGTGAVKEASRPNQQTIAQALPLSVELLNTGLNAYERWMAGDQQAALTMLPMTNSIEALKSTGLTSAISRLKVLITEYQKRYPDKTYHHRQLRLLLADVMINAGQLTEAEDILVELSLATAAGDETYLNTLDRLQIYTKLLCRQHRSEECSGYARTGLDRIAHQEQLDRADGKNPTNTLATHANFNLNLVDALMQRERWNDAEAHIKSLGKVPYTLAYPVKSRLVVALLKQPGREPEARNELEALKRLVSLVPTFSTSLPEMMTSLLESVLLFQERRYAESRDLALRLSDDKLAAHIGDRAAALKNYLVAASGRHGKGDFARLGASRSAVRLAFGLSNDGYEIFTQLLDVRPPIEENLFALDKISDPGATNEAFALIQRGTTSATGDAIAAVSARFAKGSSDMSTVIRERQDLANRRDASRRQLFEKQMTAAKEAGGTTSIESDLPAMESRLTALDQDIAQRFPEYAELIRPAILSSNQTQALVHADQAIVSWFIGKEAGWAVVVRDTGTKVVRLKVDPLTLHRTVSAVRKSVDLGPAGFVVFPAQKAYELYEALIKPIAGELAGVKTLYVVPDSTLPSLPLSLLLTRKPSKSVINPGDTSTFASAPWLIRNYAISVLPTVSSLRALQQLSKTADAPLSFFGIGDPLLADHPSLHGGKVAPRDSGAIRAISLRGVLADIGEIAKLPSLPETAGELAAIAAAFPQSSAELKLREQATEARLKTEDLSRYRVLAFATHGLVAGDFKGLAEPGLVHTPPALATSGDDGLLVASEVAGLKLNANWVVLSACNTGADDNHSANAGLGGLAKAFFYAGARTLMVSHWRVPSKATVELTTQTVTRSLNGGMGKAESHRWAMLAMIASGSNEQSHPSAWAAFATFGLAN